MGRAALLATVAPRSYAYSGHLRRVGKGYRQTETQTLTLKPQHGL